MTILKKTIALGACAAAFIACSEDKILLEKTMTPIGAGGGIARSADNSVELRFPAGALAGDQEITIETRRDQLFPRLKSSIYEFGPDGLAFDLPVTVQIGGMYSDDELTIAQIVGNNAYVVENAVWDPGKNEVTAQLEHFSQYAVIAVYNPCGNKACGDSCVVCDPLDPTCVEPAPNPKTCNQSGLCVDAALPMCVPVRDGGVTPPVDAGTVDAGTADAGPRDAGPAPCVDTELQYPQPLVDVLLVVDNSCSMSEEQQSLASNFQTLLTTLQQNNTDFHIGVTTTDVTPAGEQGALVGSVPILTPATPNIAAEYAANVLVGTSGSGVEEGLAGMSMSVATPQAAMFHRGGSSLAVIIVSDEPDASGGTAQSHVDALLAIKGPFASRRLQINTITGGTLGCMGPNGNAGAETRYEEARVATDGAHDEVCTAPYNQALTDLGDTDFGFSFEFDMQQTPTNAAGVTVTVDGNPVTSGWAYDAALNAVVFEPLAVPEPSTAVAITYQCN